MLNTRNTCFFILLVFCTFIASAQKPLTLKDAIQTTLNNYGIIKAKANYVKSATANVKESQREQLPDFNISGQQDYGTVNGQFGPSYGYKGFSVASSGPTLPNQNWTAAFGSLYLANISWDFFSFGKAKEKVKVSQSILTENTTDLAQEQFEDEVRVSTAYLNLLAAQQLSTTQQKNLDRAIALRDVVLARVKGGLNPGVDSSMANAQVSGARIALTNAQDFVQQQASQLAQFMGIIQKDFVLDTLFVTTIPKTIDPQTVVNTDNHPLLRFYQSRIGYSDELIKYYKSFYYPTFSFFSTFQERGSGFNSAYGLANPGAFTQSYGPGVDPTRGNYLIGIGLFWNLSTPLRVRQQIEAQHFNSLGLQNEYEVVDQNLKNQAILAETRIQNALKNYREAPIGLKAASDAYLQKSVLYKNGLATIVDVTQALFDLNRAETDSYIAYNNVWQALLLKSASSGDFTTFINEF